MNEMPIYEFHSPDTEKIYMFYAPSLSYANLTPLCPDGDQMKMIKLLSGFSITGRNQEVPELSSETDPDDPFAGMDPSKSGELMKELERSIAGMDEDNPDPRQMGSLMRRMCELSGEKMDEPMEEVIRKLEEGINPEELEERMGDFMGEEGDEGTPRSEDEDKEDSLKSRLRKLLIKTPARDPQLYEFKDYLPE